MAVQIHLITLSEVLCEMEVTTILTSMTEMFCEVIDFDHQIKFILELQMDICGKCKEIPFINTLPHYSTVLWPLPVTDLC